MVQVELGVAEWSVVLLFVQVGDDIFQIAFDVFEAGGLGIGIATGFDEQGVDLGKAVFEDGYALRQAVVLLAQVPLPASCRAQRAEYRKIDLIV